MTSTWTNGIWSAVAGATCQIVIEGPAQAWLTCGDQLLELSGAVSVQGNINGVFTILLSAAQPGNLGRVLSCNGFGPVRLTQSRPGGGKGLVTFPVNCLLAWSGNLGDPRGMFLVGLGWQGFGS